jgi:hypothetical protein
MVICQSQSKTKGTKMNEDLSTAIKDQSTLKLHERMPEQEQEVINRLIKEVVQVKLTKSEPN